MAGLRNVLVVEDDGMIRDLYRTTLVRDGFHVEVAGDSIELFAKLQVYQPDIILLDIMLPGLSGIDILKELRGNPVHRCQQTRIVMLTNLAQKGLAETALQCDADGYIVKADVMPTDLKQVIKSLEI